MMWSELSQTHMIIQFNSIQFEFCGAMYTGDIQAFKNSE